LRPAFFPFAVWATALLAVNNLLVRLNLWPEARLVIPIVALALLGVGLTLWWRGT
jgi:hypothetical protein